MTRSTRSSPRISSCGAGLRLLLFRRSATALYKVSLTSVDLPEPDTPVTQVISPTGIDASTFLRLLPVAPTIVICRSGSAATRSSGTSIWRLPDRYWPVSDSGLAITSSGVPATTTLPPCTPAPGPRSTTWSAARIASSSCSTTMTVLPMSRRCVSVPSRRWLSRWCRPMDGSSRMYMTPTSPEPIWLASRMRCASPPDSVSALRLSDR